LKWPENGTVQDLLCVRFMIRRANGYGC